MKNLLWFRKDLRITDNPALCAFINSCIQQQRCAKALFISTPAQWQQHDMAPIQVDFIERHVNLLAEQLAGLGITLEHIEVTDFAAQIALIKNYCDEHKIAEIFANSEVEINEQARDQKIIAAGIKLNLFESDVLVAKGRVLTGDGQMYKVFTPFKNAWLKVLSQTNYFPLPIPVTSKYPELFPNTLHNNKISFNANKISSEKWPLINELTTQVIPQFFSDKHDDYKQTRDFPALKGTSGFSPYLAIGALSVKSLLALLLNKHPNLLENPKAEIFSWLNELAWRDFYKHLLFHFPELCKHKNFQNKFDHLPWPNNPQLFQLWCQGKTGYPLVDAAMRQLLNTGWMHNRLRMVVASFLTKHLLIDWRLGERFFMQHLIDGDFSANNGGWQWAAGTGCDAQPYFRIFNPISQSEKFDPDGSFIRKYLPELKNVPAKYIHFPHEYLSKQASKDLFTSKDEKTNDVYWPAIVEHKNARLNALDFYRQ